MRKGRKKISKALLDEYLRDTSCRLDRTLSEIYGTDAFVYRDQWIIFPSTRFMWERTALLREVEVLQGAKDGGTHVLQGLLSYGPEFPSKTGELAKELRAVLGVSDEELDLTSESLGAVDDILRNRMELLSNADFFMAVLAYVGEYMRKQNPSLQWEMRRDGQVWVPWLVTEKEECPECN